MGVKHIFFIAETKGSMNSMQLKGVEEDIESDSCFGSWKIKEHGIYREYYLRLKAEGKPYGIIVNNVRNKLIHLVFSLVTNDMDYEKDHEFLREKRKSEQGMSVQLENIN